MMVNRLQLMLWATCVWAGGLPLSGQTDAPRVLRADHHAQPSGFLPNGGQWPDEVTGRLRMGTADLWMTADGWRAEVFGPGWDALTAHEAVVGETSLQSQVWQVRFVGASTAFDLEWGDPTAETRFNFYRGSDPSRWAEGLQSRQSLSYRGVWPGVDLHMHPVRGERNAAKYAWTLAPGADISDIVLHMTGARSASDGEGGLRHALGGQDAPWGLISESAPWCYQTHGARLATVPCHCDVTPSEGGGLEVRYAIDGPMDPTRPLVIDPEIQFASFVGSTGDSWGFTAGYDDNGRLIGGSGARETGYPTTAGAIDATFNGGEFDVGISVWSEDGSALDYSTYLGGGNMEFPHSIASDAAGDIFIMGTTGSASFPVTANALGTSFIGGDNIDLGANHFYGSYNAGCDLFVTKLSGPDGAMLASTFIGGSGNDGLNIGEKLNYNYGDVCRGEIAVDPSGGVWVASSTNSPDFPLFQAFEPVLQGGSDGVIFRLSNNLASLEFSSYIGGADDDAAFGIQFNAAGDLAYIAGGTKSADFITTTGAVVPDLQGDVDAFLARLNLGGAFPTVDAATFFGTQDYDQAYFVQLDTEDHPFLMGQTRGPLPISGPGVYADNPNGSTFVARFSPDLEALEWCTRVGANQTDIDISPTAFLVSDCDEVYLSGWGGATNASNSGYAFSSTTNGMPTTADAYQFSTDGSDFWLGVLAPGGTDLTYGSFLGGPFANEHVDGGTSRFDKNGTVYQAVCAGCGGFDDFPTTDGAYSENNLSSNCNLGVFKFNLGSLIAIIDIDNSDGLCVGDPIQFVNNSFGGTQYEWFFGDLNTSNEENPEYLYDSGGQWDIMLIVSDPTGSGGCLEPDTAVASVFIQEVPQPTVDLVEPICEGMTVTLQAWGGADLVWQNDPTLNATDTPTPEATPAVTTTYYVEETNACGTGVDSVTVEVTSLDISVSNDATICLGETVNLVASGGDDVVWSPAVGLSDPLSETTSATPDATTTYTAAVSTEEGCYEEGEVTVNVVTSTPGGVTWPTEYLCPGQGLYLQASPGDTYLWSPAEFLNNPLSPTPFAAPPMDMTFVAQIANVCGVGVDSVAVAFVSPSASAAGGGWICEGSSLVLEASEGSAYSWSPAYLVDNPTAQTPVASPLESTPFVVHVTDAFGCSASDTVWVEVWPAPEVHAGPDQAVDFFESTLLQGSVFGAVAFEWSPSDGLSCSDCLQPILEGPEAPLAFQLLAVSEEGCIGSDSVFVDVFAPAFVPNAFTPNNDGVNDVFRVAGEHLRGYQLEIFDRWGNLVFFSEDPQEVWLGNDQIQSGDHFLPDGVYNWRLRHELRDGPRLLNGHVVLVR